MKIVKQIANITRGECLNTFKYSFDGIAVPTLVYDDKPDPICFKIRGETAKHKLPIDISSLAKMLQDDTFEPSFRYFLDGSRRIFKVGDIVYGNRIYPVIAGQIGVGCCARLHSQMKKHAYKRRIVVSLPKVACNDGFDAELHYFNMLCKQINEASRDLPGFVNVDAVISYDTSISKTDKFEDKAVAKIQMLMIEEEKNMVKELVAENKLGSRSYLLKDGSLEYAVVDERKNQSLASFKNNYKWVVGVSKSFNPENCLDKANRNFSKSLVELPLYHRTPVQMYTPSYTSQGGDMKYAVWYVRIRTNQCTGNAFGGILKIEKLLVDEDEIENGLDSEEVDMITANIINERNPVCYGRDARWANHLYPVYVTESYVKSQYLGHDAFMNLF